MPERRPLEPYVVSPRGVRHRVKRLGRTLCGWRPGLTWAYTELGDLYLQHPDGGLLCTECERVAQDAKHAGRGEPPISDEWPTTKRLIVSPSGLVHYHGPGRPHQLTSTLCGCHVVPFSAWRLLWPNEDADGRTCKHCQRMWDAA